MIQLEILSAVALEQWAGADIVWLRTNLPDATYPFTAKQDLQIRCARGTSVEYLTKNFPGLAIEFIKYERKHIPFKSEPQE